VTSVVIVGGGPGGYEAALVAAQLGASVTLVDRDGAGGAAVLTDCVPSKTLVAAAEVVAEAGESGELGVRISGALPVPRLVSVDLAVANERIKRLAQTQSDDIVAGLERAGVKVVRGAGRLLGSSEVSVATAAGPTEHLDADVILLATGARPRVLATAVPDGERILNWQQLYDLPALPERLIVVGSGVTGAEFASAYTSLGTDVVLVSSRERVLPGEDADASAVVEEVFARRGMTVMGRSRADAVARTATGVRVTLADGNTVDGSHCLLAVGSLPNTEDLGLAVAGVDVDDRGFITVDRVSRTSARGIYAAGDCTGVLALASVAAMQGRIAMWHALGTAVSPLSLRTVSSTVFTDPEIAMVGCTQRQVDVGQVDARVVKLALATNPRAKMQGSSDGFVKLFARRATGTVVGGVVVGPRASELIYPIALAVEHGLSAADLAKAFTVYPSLSGSIAEAARLLHDPLD
jgi:pyruvate/2-oxoglutarate dehydrogenase complex dihydrolipoamide dehydrogenase (E3) component